MGDSLLRRLKLRHLQALDRAGLFDWISRSRWRQSRLAILCYHGVSRHNEHEWDGEFYIPPCVLQARLQTLVREGCTVCSLEEALRRSRDGTLPPKAVALTFDDGMGDFHAQAWPMLSAAGMRSTVYLTSFYSEFQRPIFGLFCSYLLWRARGRRILPRDVSTLDRDMDISSTGGRAAAVMAIRTQMRSQQVCAAERHEHALRLAEGLGVDVTDVIEKRLLHVMTGEEVSRVAQQGADVQLHTHRHRVPLERELFVGELARNQRYIRDTAGNEAVHFCYPSGVWDPSFFPWLETFGVASAVVGEKGYVDAATGRMQLSRFADTCTVSDLEFRSWVTGAFRLLPARRERPPRP